MMATIRGMLSILSVGLCHHVSPPPTYAIPSTIGMVVVSVELVGFWH